MSEIFGFFLESVVPRNMLIAYFLGVTLAISETEGLRTSLVKGTKFSLGIFFAAMAGLLIADILALELEFLVVWVFFLTAVLMSLILMFFGELEGDFYGMPKMFLFFMPVVGIQWIMFQGNYDFTQLVTGIFAHALGYYLAFVLIATIKEQIKISEAESYFKVIPVILIGLGVAAMAIQGFFFLY